MEYKDLDEALKYAGLSELPAENDETLIWTDAIARVIKRSGVGGYAIVVRGSDGTPSLKKTFGELVLVSSIEKIYPFTFLLQEHVPLFRDKDDIIKYLLVRRGQSHKDLFESLPNEELKNLVYTEAIKEQRMKIDINKSHSLDEVYDPEKGFFLSVEESKKIIENGNKIKEASKPGKSGKGAKGSNSGSKK